MKGERGSRRRGGRGGASGERRRRGRGVRRWRDQRASECELKGSLAREKVFNPGLVVITDASR